MVALTAASYCLFASPSSLHLPDFISHTSPSQALVLKSGGRRTRKQELAISLNRATVNKVRLMGGSFLGVLEVDNKSWWDACSMCRAVVRRCKKDLDIEGDFALEAEILEFMRNSDNPKAFPSKKQLMDAGRLDLVDAVARQGGWLAYGWDLDDNDDNQQQQQLGEGFLESGPKDWDLTTVKCNKNGFLREGYESGAKNNALDSDAVRRYGVSSFPVNSSGLASSSGRSLEEAVVDDAGIEGILSRLEKERNIKFGLGLREKRNSDGGENDWHAATTKDGTVAGLGKSNKLASFNPGGGVNNSGDKLTRSAALSDQNSSASDMWRSWSIQRAGKLEDAAEILSNEVPVGVLGDELLEVRNIGSEQLNWQEKMHSGPPENNHTDIRTRLQHLELELSSVLHTLRSNRDEVLSQEGCEGSSADLHNLSDAWEFQETEIMNTKDRLRSTRAKLAVLEGKMALAIIDAQKIVEEKQKRIDDAHRALRLIRTACIVWPNSASEVLLVGSFDGWAYQRKMVKSSTGIFSLCLKLYPGRYEIKFIVDGEWKIDPLRPIVCNNGHENNLLIVT